MPENNYDPLKYFFDQIIIAIEKALADLGISQKVNLEQPPLGLGDFAYPCFNLAPALKRSPADIAVMLGNGLEKLEGITHEPKGPYLNFHISPKAIVETIIPKIFELDRDYGQNPKKESRIILEHTSANPTDKLHVGRARNPIIGDTLARLLRKAGYNVETQYYVDDMGKQTARKILELRHNDWDRQQFKTGYQWATAATTTESDHFDPAIADELEGIMDGLESGKHEVLKEAEQVCKLMMDDVIVPSLARVNIYIDVYVNESQFMLDNSVSKIIEILKESEFSGIEDGAYYIDLTQFDLKSGKDKFFFLRADGKSLYATRDIAYHHWKFESCDNAINILGEDHKLESEYVRIGLQLTGSNNFPKSIFYAFVNLPEGRMSTRKGKVVYIDDLLDEAVKRAEVEVLKRREDLTTDEVQNIANLVGIGAVRYNIIRVQAEKKIVFKWEDALNFEGDSAPFIQYAHARACSILRKAEEMGIVFSPSKFRVRLVKNDFELALVRILGQLPGIIQDCSDKLAVHSLASYAHETAAAFNQFYRECPVLQAEREELVLTRLGLVAAARIVLNNTLGLLGISAPERM